MGILDVTYVPHHCSVAHSQLHQVPPYRADGPHRYVFKCMCVYFDEFSTFNICVDMLILLMTI